MKRLLLSLVALCFLTVGAQAANCNVASGTCFWIGGTGTMDFSTDGAHWSNATGGTTCSCEPTSTSLLNFDASSGGGTVTFGTTVNAGSITATAYTGTLDNSGNFAVTVSSSSTGNISIGGAGNPSLKMGSNVWTANGFTLGTTTLFDKGTASLVLGQSLSNPDGTTFNGITIAPPAGFAFSFGNTATFSSMTITPPAIISIQQAKTITDTDAGGLHIAGTSSSLVFLRGSSAASASSNLAVSNPSVATYTAFLNINIQTSSMTATNSFDSGHNTTSAGGSLSITNPAPGGGGGRIIGG